MAISFLNDNDMPVNLRKSNRSIQIYLK